ncbi:MAG TPA: enoyl-CoA hydratase-related protein [Thermoanaerobaculia bacterium]|nr:enoyl-CoA hydratase-related protein [Thermoanaerobaculia bacterium]
MSYEQITTETRGDVLLVTLNRPEKLNAWTERMRREMVDAIDAANNDPAIGAVVVTGAGRGFCSGADIEQTFQARIDGRAADGDGGGVPAERRDWVAFCRESKPLVAAVNGVAVGVGLTMILPFDVIVASDQARLGMFFVRMGLVPELASSYYIVERVGFAKASEMCLTGRLYPAAELAGTGMVNEVVPHEQLLPRAFELASQIAANSAPALRMIKALLTANGACEDLRQVQARETEALKAAYATPEHKEAVRAFLEKRKPDFRAAAAAAAQAQ